MDFFFDAHLHGTLKNQFADPDDHPTSPWEDITEKALERAFNVISIRRCLLAPFIESTIVSQSSLKQLTENAYKLVCFALFAPDIDLVRTIYDGSPAFKAVVDNGLFSNILVKSRFSVLNNSATSPFSIVQRDLLLLKQVGPSGQKVTFLKKRADFNPQDNDGVIHAVCTMEGLHCLRNNMDPNATADSITQAILANLDQLRQQVSVLSINPTHIDNNNALFACQAYAMDGLRVGNGLNEIQLRPRGNGLTDLGKHMVEALYQREVLVDVKHMSYVSRQQFYQFRREKGFTQPIVCSHAGFTGIWFNKNGETFTDYILVQPTASPQQFQLSLGKPLKFQDRNILFRATSFNVSTINLFNEDIEEILHSHGLIGLSLDQRILGVSFSPIEIPFGVSFDRFLIDTDFIPLAEFAELKLTGQLGSKMIDCLTADAFDEFTASPTSIPVLHFLHFCCHIMHAMEVANSVNGEAGVRQMLTETLCIGSDYDGLIDGIDACTDTTQSSKFRQKFVSDFGGLLSQAQLSLPNGLTVQQVADRIFYENGRDFVLRRLDTLVALPVVEV